MAMTFKVGDIVIGKENNGYGITDENCLLKVTAIENDEYFTGEMVNHRSPKMAKNKGNEYASMVADCFVLATKEVIASFDKKATVKEKPNSIKLGNLRIDFYSSGIESNFNRARTMQAEHDSTRVAAFNAIRDAYTNQKSIFDFPESMGLKKTFEDILNDKLKVEMMEKLINFFAEFQFEPNFRFANTLALALNAGGNDGALRYIRNYFALTASPHATAIAEKIKAPEFTEILNTIGLGVPADVINKRFKVYYGSQGTGKTTKAVKEAEGVVVVCNSAMLPQDLMEDFNFEDGKAGFGMSALWKCMEAGKPIVLDEMNLLNFDAIRFLQGLLDDKKEFIWKGETVHIKDGFQVIATMNLMVNGMAYGLPEPLVDRASEIVDYHLSGKDLVKAIW